VLCRARSDAEGGGGLSARSVLLGAVLCALIGVVTLIGLSSFTPRFWAALASQCSCCFSSWCCSTAYWKSVHKFLLTPGEFSVVAGMMLTGGACVLIVPHIVAPYYLATPANGWAERICPTCEVAAPFDSDGGLNTIQRFYDGLSEGETMPLRHGCCRSCGGQCLSWPCMGWSFRSWPSCVSSGSPRAAELSDCSASTRVVRICRKPLEPVFNSSQQVVLGRLSGPPRRVFGEWASHARSEGARDPPCCLHIRDRPFVSAHPVELCRSWLHVPGPKQDNVRALVSESSGLYCAFRGSESWICNWGLGRAC